MVHLEAGMTAIRRDGKRFGPILAAADNDGFTSDCVTWDHRGAHCHFKNCFADIIAAGYPWAELGAQVGDTVRRVWSGSKSRTENWVYTVDGSETPHPDSLYIIVKLAAKPHAKKSRHWSDEVALISWQEWVAQDKPADRPRAAHRLDLQDGDVVELLGWQDDDKSFIGRVYTVSGEWLVDSDLAECWWWPDGLMPKGHRPLFRVISRAAWAVDGMGGTIQQPDEVFTIHKRDKAYRITFPNGSDVGTVTREKL